ncbi:MAG TPA: glycosyl hydrolase family 8, partial [Ramlibacter sp.]|nr:glycosyl hydrolase family 8 [Ramlibacter sp.]
MKRRLFLSSGSAAAAMALVGCGGGGGGGATPTADAIGGTTTGATNPAGELPQGVQTGGSTAPAAGSGTGYAFGSRKTAYVAGIKPSAGNAAMDAALKQGYDNWKSKRVVKADMITAGGFAVTFSDPTFMHVSEGMGYGMLLAVVFAGHDPNAQQLFDGLLAVARTRYAYGNASVNPLGKYLMDWRLYANGSSGGEGWNAVDGDLDM